MKTQNKKTSKERYKVKNQKSKSDHQSNQKTDKIRTDITRDKKTGIEKSRGDRTRLEKPRGDRTRLEKSRGDRTGLDKTRGDRTGLDKTRGDRTGLDKTRGDRTGLDKPRGDRTRLDKTRGDRTRVDKTRDDRIRVDKARGNRTRIDKTRDAKIRFDKIRDDSVKNEKTQADRMNNGKAKSERTKADRLKTDKMSADKKRSDKVKTGYKKIGQAGTSEESITASMQDSTKKARKKRTLLKDTVQNKTSSKRKGDYIKSEYLSDQENLPESLLDNKKPDKSFKKKTRHNKKTVIGAKTAAKEITKTQPASDMTEELMKTRKEMLLRLFDDPHYQPMKIKELAILLQVPREKREELVTVLDELLAEEKISLSKRGKFGKPELITLTGSYIGNPRGFGFVAAEGMEQDVFIGESNTGGALTGDKVVITLLNVRGGRRREGRVIRVLEHQLKEIVGSYDTSESYGFVIPDNPKVNRDLFIDRQNSLGAMNGQKVVAQIINYGDERHNPEGKIISILGYPSEPGVDILSVVKAFGIRTEFSEKVEAQVESVPSIVTENEYQGRLDLRTLRTVTIDGEDAKDLDDAITIEKTQTGYSLGVHIADVSHYVREDSPLDAEALKRSTSVYLTDRVIPMLPAKLSNGICSLNQGCDRLALSCLMELDHKGTLQSHRIAETVINVDRRMTYTDVNLIIEEEQASDIEKREQLLKEYKDFTAMFMAMKELSSLLREKRKKRGSIDFDLPESKIILDENGKAIDVKPYERNTATKLIEDFMLLTNETVAEEYYWSEIPFLYRVHEEPEEEKMKELSSLIGSFALNIKIQNGKVHPKELQKLMVRIEDSPEEAFISRLTLRSMKRAVYQTECIGHFGLAAKYYCHFTSPIRRYPDLQIHRIIKDNLHGEMNESRRIHYRQILPAIGVQTSKMERSADDAEREVEKRKKCQYMLNYIGDTFEGIISGVTGWGFYVELPNTIEGLVHVNSLKNDYYTFDESNYELRGEQHAKVYRLGMPVQVVCVNVDTAMSLIDFNVLEDEELLLADKGVKE